ncbi:MAG: dolichol-phosphate mannosyltransferase, partial [Planctomycetaceae bacterium]
LTKGPVAIVLWLPPVFAMSWLSETHAKLRGRHYGLIGLVVAVIAGPWLVMVHQRDPSFLIEFFYRHNVARFAGEFHPKPWWFFVPVLLVAGHPWSFLAIPYVGFVVGRPGRSRARRTPEVGYLLLWSGWCVLFFSLSRCKLPTYVLPAAPAFALMVAQYLNEVLRGSSQTDPYFFARFWSARLATATTCLGGVGFVLFLILCLEQLSVVHFSWAMLWTTMLITSLLLLADRHQAKIAWGTSTGVAFLFSVMLMHLVVPAYSRSRTLFGDSSSLAKQLNVDTRTPIATIDHEFSEVPFYLRRADIANFTGDQVRGGGIGEFVSRSGGAILIVDNDTDPSAMLARLPAQARLIELAHRGSAIIYQVTAIPNTRIASTRDREFASSPR